MSSREIAELLGSRHDSVKRTIERLVAARAISRPPLVDGPKSTNGVVIQEYLVGKRDSYVIVAQLSPEFTARLVDRWQKLERDAAAGAFAIPRTMSEALQLAADQAKQIEQQQTLLVAQQPKVEFYDKFVRADGLLGYQEAGTAAGCYPNKFCAWLKTKYLFYRGKKLMPRAEYVGRGLFEIKPELDGNGETHLRGWVTAKGVEYFAKHAPDDIRITPRPARKP